LAWALGTIFDGLRQAAMGPEGDAVRSMVSQRADAAVALACTLTDDMDDKVRYRLLSRAALVQRSLRNRRNCERPH